MHLKIRQSAQCITDDIIRDVLSRDVRSIARDRFLFHHWINEYEKN